VPEDANRTRVRTQEWGAVVLHRDDFSATNLPINHRGGNDGSHPDDDLVDELREAAPAVVRQKLIHAVGDSADGKGLVSRTLPIGDRWRIRCRERRLSRKSRPS
jgi:hypothetical protein